MEHYDVIVVGSGSAGGVIAARLTEDEDRSVALVEAGPDFPREADLPPLFVVSGERSWVPAGIPEMDWGYVDTPAPNGHQVRLPRGRLVGGSSMVNATVAVRPAPFDLDRWRDFGNPGWGWADMLPYFKRLENDLDFGTAEHHGDRGPIAVRRYRRSEWSPVHEVFLEACSDLGLRETADLNADDAHAGVAGPWPHNRLSEVRLGTLVTYIREARPRPNFHLRADTHVDRVLLDGDRARGIRCIAAGGSTLELTADLVVLSAGAYGTPLILQRSGIGPADHLRAIGINVVADLAVGQHLLDHPNCTLVFRSRTLFEAGARLFTVNGRAPMGPGGEPEWQAFPLPADEAEQTAAIVICLNRKDAIGSVMVRDRDPFSPPLIDHRYNTLESDFARFENAFAFCRELLSRPAFASEGAVELSAGIPVRELLASRIDTAQHPASSCKMGPPEDAMAVVDHELRVHGITGLMVADASVFPDNIMHNPNLTVYAIGEAAADRIRGQRVA